MVADMRKTFQLSPTQSKKGEKTDKSPESKPKIAQDIIQMNQREFEREVLRELRPEIDSARRLMDVIESENKEGTAPVVDDRIIKFLERRYGPRLQALTIKHLNSMNADLIENYQKHLGTQQPLPRDQELIQAGRKRPNMVRSQSFGVREGVGDTTKRRLQHTKSMFLSKFSDNSIDLRQESPKKRITDQHTLEFAEQILEIERQERIRRENEESLLEYQIRKRTERQRSQDLQLYEAQVYRDIILQKRKSIPKNQIEQE